MIAIHGPAKDFSIANAIELSVNTERRLRTAAIPIRYIAS
jgi:hypothetical protein